MISASYARLSARNPPGDDDDLDDLDPDDIFDEDDFEEFADIMRSEFFYRMYDTRGLLMRAGEDPGGGSACRGSRFRPVRRHPAGSLAAWVWATVAAGVAAAAAAAASTSFSTLAAWAWGVWDLDSREAVWVAGPVAGHDLGHGAAAAAARGPEVRASRCGQGGVPAR